MIGNLKKDLNVKLDIYQKYEITRIYCRVYPFSSRDIRVLFFLYE